MLKYNLDVRAARGPGYVHRTLGESSGRVAHHRYLIAALLQEFFFVQCIWVDSYVVHRGVRGHVLEVMGSAANVEMAEYVHDCLLRQCESLWRSFKADHAIKDRRAKRQYLDGLLSGFRRQLLESQARSAERGLVWVGDPGLDAFARRRYPRTTRSRLESADGSEIRERGVEAGRRLRLHQPVPQGPARSRGRLLPHRE